MSTPAGPPRAPAFTLTSLPHDVLLRLLDGLPPTAIAAYAQLSRATAAAAADPYIWASVARRHLGVAPPHTSALTASAVSRLATALVCRWWLATGVFVAGVPVHFRKGFADARARGGVELPVSPDVDDSCYVFGGRHKDASVPVAVPSVALDFALDPAGPFPMDGMRVRLVHASEPAEPLDGHESDHLETPAPFNAPYMTEMSLGPGVFQPAREPQSTLSRDRARIRVRLNKTTVIDAVEPDPEVFSVLDVCIGPELLQTKPRMNTLIIEYDRASTAAYWLKEVSLVPAVLPVQPVPQEKLIFGVSPTAQPKVEVSTDEEERNAKQDDPHEAEREIPPRRREQGGTRRQSGPSTPPRRSLRHLAEAQHVKYHIVDPQANAWAHKGGKHQKQGKKPKHVYHHNMHHRSPRGPAPVSPGRSRSGR